MIRYQPHVQDMRWLAWTYGSLGRPAGQCQRFSCPGTAGTEGRSKRLEAIRIEVQNCPGRWVAYWVHVQGRGWMWPARNGDVAGTTGESRRIEAIRIQFLKSGECVPEWPDCQQTAGTVSASPRTEAPFVERPAPPSSRPVLIGDKPPSTNSCDENGNPCKVHPPECRGRGSNWVVDGRMECVKGQGQCFAVSGVDYCSRCGGDCGGCYGNSCSEAHLCSPGQLCVNYRMTLNAVPRWQCMPIGQGCTQL